MNSLKRSIVINICAEFNASKNASLPFLYLISYSIFDMVTLSLKLIFISIFISIFVLIFIHIYMYIFIYIYIHILIFIYIFICST